MTQSSLQTHCPKCDTRFRVTDAQLSVAGGKVRCGNCMSVFNAIEHKIDEPRSPSSAAVDKDPETSLGAGSSSQDSEDDLLFADNPEEDASESTYTGTRLTFTEDELSDSFRSADERGKASGFASEDDEEADESIDESWAEAMLSENEPRKAPESKPEPEPEPESEPEQKAPADTTEPVKESANRPESPEEDDYDGFYIDEEPLAAESFDYDMDESPEQQPGPVKSESPYNNLRREPIGVSGGGSGRLRGFLWFLVILALLGGLVSQAVWFQFDRLSAIPQLRPLYVQGCEIFGCELKPLVDVQSIQSRKLVVKTNPENRSQLMVDAVIINRASFEQPFPAIALTFSNLNNDVIAQSVFTPEEYLAGDGQDLEAMPTDTPVRILINIRDPGKDAVNYNIAFRANTP